MFDNFLYKYRENGFYMSIQRIMLNLLQDISTTGGRYVRQARITIPQDLSGLRLATDLISDVFVPSVSKAEVTKLAQAAGNISKTKPLRQKTLDKLLQSKLVKAQSIKKIFSEDPSISRLVGKLPPQWGKKLASQEGLLEVDECLTRFAKEFSRRCSRGNSIEALPLEQELSAILKIPVKVKPIGGGKFGYAYKITVDGKDYVLKCFYGFRNNSADDLIGQGNYSELAGAVFATKRDPKHFTSFHMGKFGDADDGYLLTDFVGNGRKKSIEERMRIPFSFKTSIAKVISGDPNPSNMINGKCIDFGMLETSCFNELSKLEYRILEKVMSALDSNSEKELLSIIKRYGSIPEFKKVQEVVRSIVKRKFIVHPEDFYSRKELFNVLGINYRPSVKEFSDLPIWSINTNDLAKYGFTPTEIAELTAMKARCISDKFSGIKNNF